MSAFDGGNAFPVALENNTSNSITGFHGETLEPGSRSVYGGMSLRDYFAAKAMLGAIASADQGFNGMSDQDMAAYSYALADAMLAERAK